MHMIHRTGRFRCLGGRWVFDIVGASFDAGFVAAHNYVCHSLFLFNASLRQNGEAARLLQSYIPPYSKQRLAGWDSITKKHATPINGDSMMQCGCSAATKPNNRKWITSIIADGLYVYACRSELGTQ